jgi:peptide/nickel transport system substrate-binding protein
MLYGFPERMDTFAPPNHPLASTEVTVYDYDPEKAAGILDSAGWLDLDGNIQTPRTASGVAGIPEGTPFSFSYLIAADGERPQVAEMIQNGLASCGIELEVVTGEWEVLMQPGPEGPLFGRQFDLAQLAWSASLDLPCYLFMSTEVPGPYPDFPKGWGGGNLSGYSNQVFDEACLLSQSLIPGSESYIQAHHQVQAIFTEDLPAIPLYQRYHLVAARSDMCNFLVDPSANSALNGLEMLDYGLSCRSE